MNSVNIGVLSDTHLNRLTDDFLIIHKDFLDKMDMIINIIPTTERKVFLEGYSVEGNHKPYYNDLERPLYRVVFFLFWDS